MKNRESFSVLLLYTLQNVTPDGTWLYLQEHENFSLIIMQYPIHVHFRKFKDQYLAQFGDLNARIRVHHA